VTRTESYIDMRTRVGVNQWYEPQGKPWTLSKDRPKGRGIIRLKWQPLRQTEMPHMSCPVNP